MANDVNPARDTILVVDDEAKVLDSIRRELSSWVSCRGLSLQTARSSSEALEFLETQNESVALIVSDLRMPEIPGDELLTRVRERYPKIRAILITGYSELQGVARAVSAGIMAVLLKPWETADLIREIEKAVAGARECEDESQRVDRMRIQLEHTGRIQRDLLMGRYPGSDRCSIDISYHPLAEYGLSGDYCEVLPITRDRFLFLLGDVSGHGAQAAFVTGMLKSIISQRTIIDYAKSDFSPAHFLSWMNDRVLGELSGSPDLFVAFSVTILDLSAMRVRHASAGNPPLVLLRAHDCSRYARSGPALGLAGAITFEEDEVPVHRGDRILLFTDGLLDLGSRNMEWTAFEGIARHLRESGSFNQDFIRMSRELAEGGVFHDDVVLVSAQIRG